MSHLPFRILVFVSITVFAAGIYANIRQFTKVPAYSPPSVISVVPSLKNFSVSTPAVKGVSTIAPALSAEVLYQWENTYRQSKGLKALHVNYFLESSANAKAVDMVQNNYFAHVSPDGRSYADFVQSAGYNYKVISENLAIGYLSTETVFTAWRNSTEHNSVLLNPIFTDMGSAVICGAHIGKYRNTCISVMHFGVSQ